MRAVLTYHSIDASGSPISLDPRTFAAHVAWLASGRVRVVPLDELVREPEGDGDGGAGDDDDRVALTFDDGFASFASEAAPRLRAHGLPATLFVVAAHVGRSNSWPVRGVSRVPTLPLLDWDALGALGESGVAIGAHTRTHPSLAALPPDAVAEEIEGGADEIARRLGTRPTAFAYPYGDSPPHAAACVRRRFAVGVTTELRPLAAHEDRALVPRLDAYYLRDPRLLARWGTPTFRGLIGARRAARAARRWLRSD